MSRSRPGSRTSASRSSDVNRSPPVVTVTASVGTLPGAPTNLDSEPTSRARLSALRNNRTDGPYLSMIEPITEQLIALALAEDAIGGDITSTATIPATSRGRGTFVAKAPGVISGLGVAKQVFLRVD